MPSKRTAHASRKLKHDDDSDSLIPDLDDYSPLVPDVDYNASEPPPPPHILDGDGEGDETVPDSGGIGSPGFVQAEPPTTESPILARLSKAKQSQVNRTVTAMQSDTLVPRLRTPDSERKRVRTSTSSSRQVAILPTNCLLLRSAALGHRPNA
ncbi:hypothetical protein FA95DRAFT_1569978 [Auriscalpium vulgare]|uniref:Uncharacterized protein n=1 Tax=Auriscalpium vulgare TaxID=40419 RepID=A0ACB8S5I3_9AGAM|nr:hypothetical protein FA95DRAFT_1569978 [Auriscalpium vulgare]